MPSIAAWRRDEPRTVPVVSDPGRRCDFLGVPIDCLTLDETVAAAQRAIERRELLQHGCINVAKFVAIGSDPMLADDVRSSHIINADGMGIVWAARLLGIAVPQRVAGIDVMQRMLGLCAANGYRPYFLGARREILCAAIANAQARYPSLAVAGWRDGYFTDEEELRVVATIRSSHADCLFVGMPTPRKERFLARHARILGVPFIMGVGGGLDLLAGRVRRAPRFAQALGLEWLFRVAQEPRRLGPRYLKSNAAFAAILAKSLIAKRFLP